MDIRLNTTFTLFQPGRPRTGETHFLLHWLDVNTQEQRVCIVENLGDERGPLLFEVTETAPADPFAGQVHLYDAQWVLTVYAQGNGTNLNPADAGRQVWRELVGVCSPSELPPRPPYDPCFGCGDSPCVDPLSWDLFDTDGNTLDSGTVDDPCGKQLNVTAPDGAVTRDGQPFGSVLSGGVIDVPSDCPECDPLQVTANGENIGQVTDPCGATLPLEIVNTDETPVGTNDGGFKVIIGKSNVSLNGVPLVSLPAETNADLECDDLVDAFYFNGANECIDILQGFPYVDGLIFSPGAGWPDLQPFDDGYEVYVNGDWTVAHREGFWNLFYQDEGVLVCSCPPEVVHPWNVMTWGCGPVIGQVAFQATIADICPCPPPEPCEDGEVYSTDGGDLVLTVASGGSENLPTSKILYNDATDTQQEVTGFNTNFDAGELWPDIVVPSREIFDTNNDPTGAKVTLADLLNDTVPQVPAGGQDIFLRFMLAAGDDTSLLHTVDSDSAGTYTAITDDGSSGTITVSINGGAFAAFSNPTTLVATDTIQVRRTTFSAAGWVKISGTY